MDEPDIRIIENGKVAFWQIGEAVASRDGKNLHERGHARRDNVSA